jgi:hypothetical protein
MELSDRYPDLASAKICYAKLRSLEAKRFLKIVSSEYTGMRIHPYLPSEIEGVIPEEVVPTATDIENMDFFDVPENRQLILERDNHKCFYCLSALNGRNYVIEHVISRPAGNNSYRNVVAACRQCNNRKGASSVEDYLRMLYRESFLRPEEFQDRLSHLERLQAGELKPATDKE